MGGGGADRPGDGGGGGGGVCGFGGEGGKGSYWGKLTHPALDVSGDSEEKMMEEMEFWMRMAEGKRESVGS